HKEEGTVCFGLALQDGTTRSYTKYFGSLGRDNVRKMATECALNLILEELNNH
ncbi:CinA family protein, partial [Amylibacter sp.]|nr:CinA family protein [Amylibacter sp.]